MLDDFFSFIFSVNKQFVVYKIYAPSVNNASYLNGQRVLRIDNSDARYSPLDSFFLYLLFSFLPLSAVKGRGETVE